MGGEYADAMDGLTTGRMDLKNEREIVVLLCMLYAFLPRGLMNTLMERKTQRGSRTRQMKELGRPMAANPDNFPGKRVHTYDGDSERGD